MGMVLPLIMFVAFLGLNATAAYYERQLSRPPTAVTAGIPAQNFLTYRNAVSNFMAANPGFSGTIPLPSLLQYMPGATATAMSGMNNTVSAAPGGGTQIAVIAQNLAAGAASSALSLSQNDASVGMVRSGQWTSYSAPNTPISLPVPDSNLVSLTLVN